MADIAFAANIARMCGRFFNAASLDAMAAAFDAAVATAEDWRPSWNIRPQDRAPILLGGQERRLGLMTWGWQAEWAKRPLINARSDKLASSKLWRPALERRRCLVPATGWWEWRGTRSPKTPYAHAVADGGLTTFAGLWSRDGDDVRFAIVVTEASASIAHVHDRMPVVLDEAARTRWLDPESAPGELADLCRPLPEEKVGCHPVAPFALGADGPELLAPAEDSRAE